MRQTQQLLNVCEQLISECSLIRAVLLRLHNVNRTGTGVLTCVVLVQARDCTSSGDDGIHDALEDLLAVAVEDGRVLHQVADVTDQVQGTTVQGDLGTVKSGVGAVVVDGTGQLLAATGELDCEVTDVQAQPVGVTQGLVCSVDCGDRVLEVHDVGDSGFQDDVLDTSLVGLANRGLRVNQQLDVQTVVLEVNGLRCVLVAGVAD